MTKRAIVCRERGDVALGMAWMNRTKTDQLKFGRYLAGQESYVVLCDYPEYFTENFYGFRGFCSGII
jgi:hypothetical protein